MDWVKVLLDKFFVLIVVLIPGGSAILVIALGRPGFWSQFWGLGYLGYQTKVALLVSFAFILGSTANNIIGFIVVTSQAWPTDPRMLPANPIPNPRRLRPSSRGAGRIGESCSLCTWGMRLPK
jgi:hypothetical protein